MKRQPPRSTPFPYTTLFRSCDFVGDPDLADITVHVHGGADPGLIPVLATGALVAVHLKLRHELVIHASRSEEHTSELQSRQYLVCRLLLEKKKRRASITRAR